MQTCSTVLTSVFALARLDLMSIDGIQCLVYAGTAQDPGADDG